MVSLVPPFFHVHIRPRPMARSRPQFLVAALLLLTGATALHGQQVGATQRAGAVSFKVMEVVDDLKFPLSMAFLPDGDMLVTEKAGTLRRVHNGVVSPTPITGTPTVVSRGQAGLHEVTPHPQFATNKVLYFAYAKATEGGKSTTALARGRLEGNAIVDLKDIFVAQTNSSAGQHYGGRIAFDKDGYLFLSVGDRGAPPSGDLEAHPAQNPGNHQGTINRLFDDGRVPPDNPFVGQSDKRPEIWSYGHRNPQGLAFHPVTGVLFEVEHGPMGGDELNTPMKGRNFGWPVITYGQNYNRTPITSERARPGMEQPVKYWVPSIATSGLMIYNDDKFPAWKGSVFVGGLAGQQLARVTLDGTTFKSEETLLKDVVGRIRDVRQGPDGFIYIAVDKDGGAGTIVRLEPAP
jgi:aldose sugar dehydrogenase